MSRCAAGLAVTLMLLKMFTWLVVARFSGSLALNAAYVSATLLMLWSYAMAVGVTPASHPPSDGRVRATKSDLDDDTPRYCERCDAPKAAHVHHCSSCRRCVYRMDHHCPWTNNCVGWDNKKHFLLFLLYTALSCLLFTAIVTPLVWHTRATGSGDASLLQLTWALSLVVGAVLAGYLLFHVYLLHRGLTTFEFLTRQRGELEATSFLYNARVFFGTNVALWWLPIAPKLDPRMRGGSQWEVRELLV